MCRSSLKRHRLPVPTHEPRLDSAATGTVPSSAGFYSSYHPSPTTTNTLAGGTGTNTITSGGSAHHHNGYGPPLSHSGYAQPMMGTGSKVPKTPAPSIDFGSDISSVSQQQHGSHTGPYPAFPPHHPAMSVASQQSMHFLNPQMYNGY